MATSINACPICGIEMYTLERSFEMWEARGEGTVATELTVDMLEHTKKQFAHEDHLHLIEETRPGVYQTFKGSGPAR